MQAMLLQDDKMKTPAAGIARLRFLLRELLKKFPTDNSYPGTRRCLGCGALLWSSSGIALREPCKPDCIVQEAIKEAYAR